MRGEIQMVRVNTIVTKGEGTGEYIRPVPQLVPGFSPGERPHSGACGSGLGVGSSRRGGRSRPSAWPCSSVGRAEPCIGSCHGFESRRGHR